MDTLEMIEPLEAVCVLEHVPVWVIPDNGLPKNGDEIEFVLKGSETRLTGIFHGTTATMGPRFEGIVLSHKRMPVEVRCWRKLCSMGVLPKEEE